MKTIHKYQLTDHHITLLLPVDAVFLDVQMQAGTPCLWALVDHEAARFERRVAAVGTGWGISEIADWQYVGTFQDAGQYVWHVFVESPTTQEPRQ